MRQKRYWLRGLLIGIFVFVILCLMALVFESIFDGGTFGDKVYVVQLLVVPFLLPLIPIGLLVGWIYGKINKSSSV